MTSSQNAALLAQWADLWGGNISLADELVTDDFVTHVAPLPWAADVGETGGREALKRWISGGVRLLIPDMRFSVDVGPIADEHYMVVRWKVEGTYNGGVPGSSPDTVGRTVAFTGTNIVPDRRREIRRVLAERRQPVFHAADRRSRGAGAGITGTRTLLRVW